MSTISITSADNKTVTLAVKWILLNATQSGGGVQYERQPISTTAEGTAGTRTESIVVKKVDHEPVVAKMAKLRNKIDYMFRSHATLVSFGFVATDEQLAKLRAEIGPLKEEADALNEEARTVGSRHRIRIAMMTALLSSGDGQDGPAAAKAIADTITSHLADYKDALLALDLNLVKTIQIRSRNLDKLALGVPGTILRNAVDCVKAAVKDIKKGIKDAHDPSTIRASLELTPIDVAVSWFNEDVVLHADNDPVDVV